MADVERMATMRMHKGKKNDDRITGNLTWYGVEHFEGRPTKEDNMPDWQRHLHFVVFNQTKDFEEGGQWKALKMRPVYDVKKYLDRRFNQRFSKKVADLGYEIETKWESDGKGGRKFVTWDIKDIPKPVLDRFSRRTQEVQGIEQEIVREIKERDPDAPDRLSAVARNKLGATSRRFKRKDLTLADYRAYWNGRVTPEEGRQIAQTIKRAMLGQNPRPVSRTAEAVTLCAQPPFRA